MDYAKHTLTDIPTDAKSATLLKLAMSLATARQLTAISHWSRTNAGLDSASALGINLWKDAHIVGMLDELGNFYQYGR